MSRCAVCGSTPSICFLHLPGESDSFASTPDAAKFAVGANTLQVDIALKSSPLDQDFVLWSQWEETNNRGWIFLLRYDLHLSFRASGNGVDTTVSAVSTLPIPPLPRVLRVNFQPNNGSGGWTATFFTRPSSLPITWTQLGDPVTGTPNMTVFNSTAPVLIGAAG